MALIGSNRAPGLRQLFLAKEAIHPEGLLAVLGYGGIDLAGIPSAVPQAEIALGSLDHPPRCEVWYAVGAVTYGEAAGIRYACAGDSLFGVVRASAQELDSAGYAIYLRLVGLARQLGYPALWRMWNYFPGINRDQDHLERYRRFCVGRYQAFAETGFNFAEDLPAASAIGSTAGDLWVAFIAGRGESRQIENPRQVSAFHYPPNYGPRSPSFARARLVETAAGRSLFISGTASILGHETVHPGDPSAQCHTTLDNLRVLLDQVGMAHHLGEQAAWKVYLRHAEDLPAIQACLSQHLATDSPMLYLVGDICRASLLLEIEGVVSIPN